eukprot:SAG11_NODE_1152_length_5663_cov_110.803379_6_plen_39_part_00
MVALGVDSGNGMVNDPPPPPPPRPKAEQEPVLESEADE